jgi:cytochrome c oxidase subunit II
VATGSHPGHGGRGRPARRAFSAVAGGIAVLGLLGACSVEDAFAFGWPKGGVTPDSQRMFDLWIGSTIAALAVGALVWGLIFWCVVVYRKRGEALPAQTRYNLPIELVYSVAPFLVVSVLFYYTAVVQTDVNQVSDNPDVVVTVEGFKWNWKFSYGNTAGPDGQPVYTVGTSDYVPVLVLPSNRSIRFVLRGKDVIHSFWVPELLFKRDVFPGSIVNQFETTIMAEGAYVGRCAELCGTYHSMMNFEVRVVSPEEYAQFLERKAAGDTTPAALLAIGEEPLATTTYPFPTKRGADATTG